MISFARTTTLIFMQGRAKPLSPPITDRGGRGVRINFLPLCVTKSMEKDRRDVNAKRRVNERRILPRGIRKSLKQTAKQILIYPVDRRYLLENLVKTLTNPCSAKILSPKLFDETKLNRRLLKLIRNNGWKMEFVTPRQVNRQKLLNEPPTFIAAYFTLASMASTLSAKTSSAQRNLRIRIGESNGDALRDAPTWKYSRYSVKIIFISSEKILFIYLSSSFNPIRSLKTFGSLDWSRETSRHSLTRPRLWLVVHRRPGLRRRSLNSLENWYTSWYTHVRSCGGDQSPTTVKTRATYKANDSVGRRTSASNRARLRRATDDFLDASCAQPCSAVCKYARRTQ